MAAVDVELTDLDRRYRRALTRYARSLLRRSHHDAEDVVQDVLVRAHAAISAGERPQELRPWLFRLTRNRAIDEVRRARWGDAELDDLALVDRRAEPEGALMRREAMRGLVEDLADLPPNQRAALLAREVDGQSSEDVAAALGVSVPAAQMLAARARQNLVKARAARDADCADIRSSLAAARERGSRSSEHARRHLAGCAPCRAYSRDLRHIGRRLRLLTPPGMLGPLAGVAVKLASSKGAGVAAVVVLAAGGGAAVLAREEFHSGQPAPFTLAGIRALTGSAVRTGNTIPPGTAVVTARLRVTAGVRHPDVAVSCPAGMRIAGMAAPEQAVRVGYGLAKSTIVGHSRRGAIQFGRSHSSAELTVGLLCRRLGPTGSLAAHPRLPHRGERAATICADSSYVQRSPGKVVVGTVFRDQPVSVLRYSHSRRWVRIAPDVGMPGWVRASILC